MSIFNKFKKTKKEEPKEEITLTSEQLDSLFSIDPVSESYVSSKMSEIDNKEAFKNTNSRVSDYANSLLNDMKEKKFQEQYYSLIDFKNTFMIYKRGVKLDVDSLNKYLELVSSSYMDKSEEESLFLPFLLEKESLGILTNSEKKELDELKNKGNLEFKYRKAIMYYQILGFGDIKDKSFFSNTFSKYGNLSEVSDDKLVEISRRKFSELADSVKNRLGFDESAKL